MEIIEGKRKTKIIFSYSNKDNVSNFDTANTKQVNIRVFLHNGKMIDTSEIESFTINSKGD